MNTVHEHLLRISPVWSVIVTFQGRESQNSTGASFIISPQRRMASCLACMAPVTPPPRYPCGACSFACGTRIEAYRRNDQYRPECRYLIPIRSIRNRVDAQSPAARDRRCLWTSAFHLTADIRHAAPPNVRKRSDQSSSGRQRASGT